MSIKKKDHGKPRLGRGLAALLGKPVEEMENPITFEEQKISNIQLLTVPVEMLEAGPFQPRQIMQLEALQELAESIKHHGILQPLLVREKPDHKGYYQIIAGERRWRAAQLAMLHELPVRVCYLNDSDAMAAALVENLQRADLNIIEEAEGFQRLLNEFNLTQDELAGAVGKSRSHITNIIRLLQLPLEVLEYLKSGALSAGHARALLMHPEPVAAAKEVIAKALTVRQTEDLVKREKERKEGKEDKIFSKQKDDQEIRLLEKDLCGKLGLNVKIQFDGKGGSLRIFYKSLEQFDELLEMLKH